MNLVQKVKVKQLISKLSNDPNYTLPLKEQAYYQSLLLKEGIELSLILTLLKMGEITFPKSFNFSLSPDFIEREKLKVKVNPNQNYFEICKQLDISFASEDEVKDMKKLRKMVTSTKSKGNELTDNEKEFADEVKDANPNISTVEGGYNATDEGDLTPEDLDKEDSDDDIMDRVKRGTGNPVETDIKKRYGKHANAISGIESDGNEEPEEE